MIDYSEVGGTIMKAVQTSLGAAFSKKGVKSQQADRE